MLLVIVVVEFLCSCIQDLQGTPHEFDTDEGRTDAGDSMSIQTGTTGPSSRRYVLLVCLLNIVVVVIVVVIISI